MKKLLLVLISSVFAAGVFAAEDPKDVLEANTQKMLTAITENKAAIEADPAVARQLVLEHLIPQVDAVTMTRKVLGRYWRDATDEQKSGFADAFVKLTVNTYAKGIALYDGQTFEYSKTQFSRSGKTALVRSEMQQPKGPPVHIDYRLRADGDGWKVTDVIIEGISMAKSYATQYKDQINDLGLQATLEQLQRQAAQAEQQLESESEAAGDTGESTADESETDAGEDPVEGSTEEAKDEISSK